MELKEMIRKYAYTLARVGLNVQKGQTVLVEAAIEGASFTPVFAEECYKLGAGNVVIHYLDEPNLKVASLYRKKEDVEKVEEWEALSNQKWQIFRRKRPMQSLHMRMAYVTSCERQVVRNTVSG